MSQAALLEYPIQIALGSVVALYRKPARGVMEVADSLEAVGGKGFVGDYSFGKRRRQALLLSTVELNAFGYRSGELRENITLDIPGLQSLPIGTVITVGEVEFEIEQDCAPCGGMARRLGEDRQEFVAKMAGNRGMLCKVRSSGTIRVGDVVKVRGG
ncbi:MOSC domain-containing protein [Fimbriimonas ginsengisoli]|uniref:Molybdenum cofactor sulfurase domain containing protein n=1 Tax=Fimbriimonas ginsengisoli Gsoil 348 TaxID=661478 RepID=A0A068NRB3_FIMGI|nr:MOSC domain-containing protein [Fimbriimonas ginsengisoli]AIE84129.1 molybdenum cofactor sulfurase domain containing protein [Fimbriimonas ginsengisoli Gsoil 348]